jgi:hypothetical protein
MVITSTPSNGSSSTTLEQVEPVKDDPPIGGPRHLNHEKPVNSTAKTGAGTPVSSPRDDLCKNAHVNDVATLATQLEVDVK